MTDGLPLLVMSHVNTYSFLCITAVCIALHSTTLAMKAVRR